MASQQNDAIERETTELSRQALGTYIRTQLAARGTTSVEVYKRGDREFTRTWKTEFDHTGLKIVSAGEG